MSTVAAPAPAPTAAHAPVPPPATMMQFITGAVWVTKAIYVAAKLGLADLVAQEPRTAEALAAAAGAHAASLGRLLRALASLGIFAEDDKHQFHLTPLAATLQKDIPGSLRAMAILWGEPWHWDVWGSFLHGVQTGEIPWRQATGQELFTYFAAHPERAGQFDAAMSAFSGQEAAAVTAAYDFSGIRTLMDVGGGQGLLLATILRANPHLRGILVEVPPVAESAHQQFDAAGLGERVEVVGGDFFTSLPTGADACILKNILHDFADEPALAILRSCWRALPTQGKLLVSQEVLPPGNAPSIGKLMDLQMLLIGGQERTEGEYRVLYEAAGFELRRVLPTASPLHVIEGLARDP